MKEPITRKDFFTGCMFLSSAILLAGTGDKWYVVGFLGALIIFILPD